MGATGATPPAESIVRDDLHSDAPEPYSLAMHALLTHLESVGFDGAPRSYGWDKEGRHLVEFIQGTRGDHPAAPDFALDPARYGHFIRKMHDALEGFVPPEGAQWFEGIPAPDANMIVHQDVVPANIVVTESGRMVAIDWDAAAPGTRLWDLAHSAHAIAPLIRKGFDISDCARGLRSFVDGYRLDEAGREALIPLLAERSERMFDYLNQMRHTGQSPWVELWERGVGTVWKADAQWIRDHEYMWRAALLN